MPGERNTAIHWTGGWAVSKTRLDTTEKRKIFAPSEKGTTETLGRLASRLISVTTDPSWPSTTAVNLFF